MEKELTKLISKVVSSNLQMRLHLYALTCNPKEYSEIEKKLMEIGDNPIELLLLKNKLIENEKNIQS